tara:strand:+ start:3770 stop:5083 length:1314 start_codon:yes stop_codon:yes gene_type:complete
MSLVDRANELEYVPEEQLIQMSQSPEGQYPQFLVLSEIQRRNQMRRMYENQTAKMNQPTTTVAEESVMELAGQGAVPMMDSLSSLSSSEGGLRSMAPTLMKSGGITEMQSGRSTALEQSFMPPGRNELPMSSESASSLRGGISNLAETLGLIDEEGNIDPVQASLLGLSFVPGLGLVAGAGRLGLGVAKFLAPKARSFFMKPNPVLSKGLQPGQRVIVDPNKGKTMIQSTGKDAGKIIPKTVADVSKIATTAGAVATPFAVSNIFAPDESTESVVEELTEEQKEIKRLQDLLAEANKPKDESEPVKKGLGSDDFLTLAQVGGIFGGAKNLGEAAMGLGNLAGQIQTTRREGKLEGLQGRVLQAQAAKYEADIANMKPTQINSQLQTIENLIQAAIDSGNQDEVSELFLYQQLLNKRLLELQGIDIPESGSYGKYKTA